MTEIRKDAVKIMQGKHVLFATAFTVRDFMTKDFYRVETLDVQGEKGMQRILNEARARSFSDDIRDADGHSEAFLPTSVFLATSGKINYDDNSKELFFDTEAHAGVCPLDVVDGQHRIKGLEMAIQKNKKLLDFPVFAVIAPEMNEPMRMLQFVTVNTKQQPINESIRQAIVARFSVYIDNLSGTSEGFPYLPTWLNKQANTRDDERAINILKALNNEQGSPWHNKIRFANEPPDKKKTDQTVFIRSVKRYNLLTENHPLSAISDTDNRRSNILSNFWKAVAAICVNPSDVPGQPLESAVFKYGGVLFFHNILSPVIVELVKKQIYTVSAMEECIRSAQNYLPPESANILTPDYWKKGGPSTKLNRSGLEIIAADFTNALRRAANENENEN